MLCSNDLGLVLRVLGQTLPSRTQGLRRESENMGFSCFVIVYKDRESEKLCLYDHGFVLSYI